MTKSEKTLKAHGLIATRVSELAPFIGRKQRQALRELLNGEEGEWFADKLIALHAQIEAMPKTGDTNALGDSAIVHLHYFLGSYDAWITEKDMGDGTEDLSQHQAYGKASFYGVSDAEWGYISIEEAIDSGAELDLHWTPKPMKDVK